MNQSGSSAEHIVTRCPSCQKKLRVPARMAGRKAKCPQCAHELTLPAASDAAAAPAKAAPQPKPAAPRAKAPAPKQAKPIEPKRMWYVQTEDGEQYGPIERSELDEWHAEGRISADCYVYYDGAEDWMGAEKVYPDLAAAQPAAAAQTADNPFAFDSAPAGGGGGNDDNPFAAIGDGGGGVTQSRSSRSSSSSYGRGKQAPKSGLVTAVAVIEYIMGGLSLILGGLYLLFGMGASAAAATFADPDIFGGIPEFSDAADTMRVVAILFYIVGAITLITGGGAIAAGVGVQKRANWGRILALILAGLTTVVVLLTVVAMVQSKSMMHLITVIPNAAYAGFVFIVLLGGRASREFR